MPPAKLKESDLYAAVKAWFVTERGCAAAYADLPEDERKMRVVRNGRKREIDVWAFEQTGAERPQVHVAEGKLLTKGNSVDECVSQTESVRAFGDRLWVFFPAGQWDALPAKERADNEERVRERGMGLLLVDGEECRLQIPASPNPKRDEKEIRAVLGDLWDESDDAIPHVAVLGTEGARTAAATMVVAALAEKAVARALAKLKRRVGQWSTGADAAFLEHGCYIPWLQLKDRVSIENDSFGWYAKDGRPVMWVWKRLSPVDVPMAIQKPNHVYTHWYFDNGEWRWHTLPAVDMSAARAADLLRAGFSEVRVGRRIDVLGRTLQNIADEIAAGVTTAGG